MLFDTTCSICKKSVNSKYVIFDGDRAICHDCIKKISDLGNKYGVTGLHQTFGHSSASMMEEFGSAGCDDNKRPHELAANWTPREVKKVLDKYVIGQEHAKRVLAVAAYEHFKRMQLNDPAIQKSNVLLVGPSGSGKTYLMQTLAKAIDVPLAICPATTLTEAGYKGDDVQTIVAALYRSSGKDLAKCERGIIFIDEIDKLGRGERGRDGFGQQGVGVQQALLPIIEGTKVTIKPEGELGKTVDVDTKNILFVCGGAFPDLEKIVKRRLGGGEVSVGFCAEIFDRDDVPTENILTYAKNDDLIEFGFIPEFLGRLPVLTFLNELTVEDLKAVAFKPANSILTQFKALFRYDNIELSFDDDALTLIAEKAKEEGTGARGLRKIIEDILLNVRYDAPGSGLKNVRITKKFIEGNRELSSLSEDRHSSLECPGTLVGESY